MTTDESAVQAGEMKPALAPHFYRSQEVFDLERARIFHAQWFCVGREAQLPAKGDFLHVSVAGESLFVVRGKDEELRAFYNVCRHRGSRAGTHGCGSGSGGHPRHRVLRPHGRRHRLPRTTPGATTSMARWRASPHVRFDESCPEEQLLAGAGEARHLGRVHLREPERCAGANPARAGGRGGSPARALSPERHAPRRPDRVRRARELEDHHGELQRVLSLRAGAPGAVRARAGLPRAGRRRPHLGRRHPAPPGRVDVHAERHNPPVRRSPGFRKPRRRITRAKSCIPTCC